MSRGINRGMGRLHPVAGLCYYVGAICFLFLFNHPFFVITSLLTGVILNCMQGTFVAKRKLLMSFLGVSFVTMLLNPLLSHRGTHILFYFHYEPITLESSVFGMLAAISLFSNLIWFLSIQYVFTSDKIVHLFGKFSPKGALLLAMALRSLPLISTRYRQLAIVQRTQGVNLFTGNIGIRVQTSMKFMQAMLTWTLEEGLQTADSMKARGYGSTNRTQFWPFRWRRSDSIFTAVFVLFGLGCFAAWLWNTARYEIYPTLPAHMALHHVDLFVYFIYLIYFCIPMLLEGWGMFKWRNLS